MYTNKEYPFDIYCKKEGVLHTLIRPLTPKYNGKVKRSHRNDNEKFYKFLSFYSYKNLILQMKPICIIPIDFLCKL